MRRLPSENEDLGWFPRSDGRTRARRRGGLFGLPATEPARSPGSRHPRIVERLEQRVLLAAPVAIDQAISTAEDVATSGQVAANDADGDALTYTLVGQAAQGTAAVNADGSFTYTPALDANGADSFTFKANDGTADGNVATVTIAVTPVNDAPRRTSAAPAPVVVDEDSFNVTAVPLGLGALTYAPGPATATDEASQALSIRITAIPSTVTLFNGATPVALNDALTPAQFQGLTYKTVPDANGSGPLTWTVTDTGSGDAPNVNTLAESLTITVDAVNDRPTAGPVFVSAQAGEGTQVTLTGSDVETPPSLTFAIVVGPTRGTLTGFDAANGTVIYTPGADQTGTDSFTYTVTDAGGATSAAATVSIVILAEADLAVAVAATPAPPAGVRAGETLTYAITVTNNGPSNALGAVLTDVLPTSINLAQVTVDGGTVTPVNGTLTIPLTSPLNRGASQTVVITVVPTVSGGGTLFNTASVAGNVSDTNPANNSVTTSTPLLTADLAVTIDDGEDFATVGVDLTYTITIENNGPESARDVILTYTLPANVTPLTPTVRDEVGDIVPYEQVGNVLTFFRAPVNPALTLAPNQSKVLRVVVQPTNAAINTTLSSTAQVSSPDDPALANNRATESTGVGFFSIRVTEPGDYDPDTSPPVVGTLRWAIELANAHPNANGVLDTITIDSLPLGPNGLGRITLVPSESLHITESVNITTIDPTIRGGVEIDASCLDTALIIDGEGSTIRGLTIFNYEVNGIILAGQGGHTIVGNIIIGSGYAGAGCTGDVGILVTGSPDNRIGGTEAGDRNVISGNIGDGDNAGVGVHLTGAATTGNRVVGGSTSDQCKLRGHFTRILHAATGNPYRSILPQNCDHRSVVYVRHRTLNTAAAPGSFHFIPEPHNRCFTSTLHAASVTPLPIGSLTSTRER